MDYVYGTLSNHDGEDSLDYMAIRDNPMEFIVVAANAVTGEAKYFDKQDIRQDHYDVFKASSSIPFICKPYFVQGTPYYDGALGDPVPAEKLRQRASRHNEGVALAQEYAKQGKALIVAPDDTCGVGTLSRDPTDMRRLYENGYADGQK